MKVNEEMKKTKQEMKKVKLTRQNQLYLNSTDIISWTMGYSVKSKHSPKIWKVDLREEEPRLETK